MFMCFSLYNLNNNTYFILGGIDVQGCSSYCKCIETIDSIPCRCVCRINNTELTQTGVTTTSNGCGNNIKIDYLVTLSYQDNRCLNTTICKECSINLCVPSCCCAANSYCATFDCLNVEQISRNEIVVRAKCNIKN